MIIYPNKQHSSASQLKYFLLDVSLVCLDGLHHLSLSFIGLNWIENNANAYVHIIFTHNIARTKNRWVFECVSGWETLLSQWNGIQIDRFISMRSFRVVSLNEMKWCRKGVFWYLPFYYFAFSPNYHDADPADGQQQEKTQTEVVSVWRK